MLWVTFASGKMYYGSVHEIASGLNSFQGKQIPVNANEYLAQNLSLHFTSFCSQMRGGRKTLPLPL